MDKTDQKLIAALRHDARASLSDLALLLGVSRTTIRGRIERLRQRGDILGFSVVLKEDALRDPVRGLMMIGIEGRGTDRIIRQLQGFSEVRAVHSTNGRWDVIAEIGTHTLEDPLMRCCRKSAGWTGWPPAKPACCWRRGNRPSCAAGRPSATTGRARATPRHSSWPC